MITVLFAIIKLFIIVAFGFVFYKKQIIKEDALSFLTFLVINIAFPLLIFTNMIENFSFGRGPAVCSFLLSSLGMFVIGAAAGCLVSFSIPAHLRRESISLATFQNCGYLPMNLALFLFSGSMRSDFLLYIFLYSLGFNILMWSVGTFFIFRRSKEDFQPRSLLTPPIVSVLVSLLAVFFGVNRYIPDVILSPLKIIGDTAFPLSMIILGVWLAKDGRKALLSDMGPIIKVSVIKLAIVPAIVFFLLVRFRMYSLFGLFLLLEAGMPAAASLPIVVHMREGNTSFVSRGVFYSHLASIVTVPLWLGLFLKVSAFQL